MWAEEAATKRRVTLALALMAAVSTVLLIAVHAMQTFLKMSPCELCLQERQFHWAGAAIALVGLGVLTLRPRYVGLVLLALVVTYGWSTWVASFHAGVEWKFWPGPQACTGSGSIKLTARDLAAALSNPQLKFVRCDEAAWRLAGISLAGWNALLSAGLAILSVGCLPGAKKLNFQVALASRI